MKKLKDVRKKLGEEIQFKVDVEGMPPTFMNGRSSAEILAKLRKIVKQPSMIKGVERYTTHDVKKAYRNKAQGRDMDEAVTYHGNPNKDDDARNAARRKKLAKQDNMMKKRAQDNEKARQALKDPSHNPAWANSKSKVEASVVPSKDGKSLVPMKKRPETIDKPVPNSQFGLPRLKKTNEAVDSSDTGGAEEVSMGTGQIKAMRHYLDGIEQRIKSDGDMEEWFQNKLTKANDYLKTLYGYGKGKTDESTQVDEISADLAKRYHKKATEPGATKPASDLGHTKDSMRKTHNRVVGSNRAMDRMFRAS